MSYLRAVMASPLHRQVAATIAALRVDIPIRLGQLPANKRGEYTPPSVLPGRKANVGITIDPRKGTLETVLHEAVHAATTAALRFPKTAEQRAAGARMWELFRLVEQQPGAQQFYGVNQERGKPGTIEEFVAEAFSNPQFQKFLNGIKLPGAPQVTAWTAFKQFVMDLIGRPTVLSETLMVGSDLFSPEQRAGAPLYSQPSPNSPPPTDGRANAVPRTAITGVNNGVRTFIAYAKDKDDPNTKYTLYPVNSQFYRGDASGKIVNQTRDQVEQHIRRMGSQVVAPASDTSVASGTPKDSSTKRVGYDKDGNLKSAAFEQKDGTWTYYESDDDVRTDPDARVVKGLSTTAVERFISARGLNPEPPKGGAVKTTGTSPTGVHAYDPASSWRRKWQDQEATAANIGGDVDLQSQLKNSRYQRKWREMLNKYVEPARMAGQSIVERFGKPQVEIETLMQKLHVIERSKVKQQQFYRGNMQGAELQAKIAQQAANLKDAEDFVRAARGSNPAYVTAVEQELAPKIRLLTNHTTDLAAQYGLITREDAEQIKKAYDYYVPLQSGDKKTTVHKAATGASVSGDQTFARIMEQGQRTIARGEQNLVRQEVYKIADRLYNRLTKSNPVTIGPEFKTYYNKETNSLNTGENSFAFDPNAVDVYVAGKRIRMKIEDESLLEALHAWKGPMREEGVTTGIAVLGRINRLISIGKTSLNPTWPPFNFIRDVLTSNINLPKGVSRARYNLELLNLKNYGAVLWNVAKEAFGAMPSGMYADAKDAGAFISHRAFIGLDPIASDVSAMFKPPLLGAAKVGQYKDRIFEILSIPAQMAESVPRMAMYKAAQASYAEAGMTPAAAKERAAYDAKNASVNFEKRGSNNVSNYWIFGNAKMQGVRAFINTVERHGMLKAGMGSLAVVGLGAMAASFGLEWSEKDKDGKSKYSKIPDLKKDSMFLMKEDAYGIPIPQEILPFYVLGQVIVEGAKGTITEGRAAARFLTSFFNQLWPGSIAQQDPNAHAASTSDFVARMLVPSQFMPVVESMTNKNTWGREVVAGLKNKRELGIPMSEMGDPTEAQLATNLSKNGLLSEGPNKLIQAAPTLLARMSPIEVAPQQIKLWNNYLNPFAEGYAAMRDMFGGREEKYVGDIVNPLERRFTGKATEFYDQEQFEELLAKAKHAEYKTATANPNRVPIGQLPPEERVLAQQAPMLKKVESDGNNLFKGSHLMSPEQRKRLNERKREMVLSGIRRYNEARDRMIPQR